ncbi:hypothetical protein ADN00_05715 [Ornatilinea apprima]|uniref:Deoxyhypusine synthase n=1 Tax=Ornatilinea apprima TaxID=1134406 RepID=A0A0P6X6Q5_9CHLR|nr:hypothetical protein [Ornatilinea apprima]KPL78737.1 hypothetical protein ADN00_05715 [Ornatilinea apprima]
MPFPQFDRSRLKLKPLSERIHDLTLDVMMQPTDPAPSFENPDLPTIADRILRAREAGSAIIVMMGAHVLRKGNALLLIDMMKRGLISHIALNGAGVIHDFEFALIGATTESVPRYISEGQFGLWTETGYINDAMVAGQRDQLGLGEAAGRMIEEGNFPYKEYSILAAAYKLQVPITVHVGIGQDIIHEHPNLNGAALGDTSYRDFLIFAESVRRLEGGVLLNIGTSVMGPEVYLKALSMARNVAKQEGKSVCHFTTAVFDLIDLGPNYHNEAPKTNAAYYFRPYKTILVRTVQDGGESFYIQGDHRVTVPSLYHQLISKLEEK